MAKVLVFVFPHKTASMFGYKLAQFIAEKIGAPHFSRNNKPPNIQKFPEGLVQSSTEDVLILGPVRTFKLPTIDLHRHELRVACQVRDPRDLAVSEFFWAKYTSGGKDWKQERKDFRSMLLREEMTIDEYVLATIRNPLPSGPKLSIIDRFNKLEALCNATPGCKIFFYENMVKQFEEWLWQILDHLECGKLYDAALSRFGYLFDLNELQERRELMEHRRKILPGDFKEKLTLQTIEEVNRVLLPILDRYGYDL